MWKATDADQHRWQMAALNRLSTLVRIGTEKHYPALKWTVDTTGGLVGTVTITDANPRETWELWVSEIDANRRTETLAPGGITRLYAATTRHYGTAPVAITATLFPPDDNETETGSDAQ